eukprot:1390175-Pleurochrysis_carterae.AAC.2
MHSIPPFSLPPPTHLDLAARACALRRADFVTDECEADAYSARRLRRRRRQRGRLRRHRRHEAADEARPGSHGALAWEYLLRECNKYEKAQFGRREWRATKGLEEVRVLLSRESKGRVLLSDASR